MRKSFLILIPLFIVLNSIIGCVTSQPQSNTQSNTIDNRSTLTLGTVQRKIKRGLSQSEVITALGSPNIVTNDDGKATWVYDKISTISSKSQVKGGVAGAGVVGTGVGVGGVSGSRSDSTTFQKTLTVIIKFDNNNVIEKVLYHTSKY